MKNLISAIFSRINYWADNRYNIKLLRKYHCVYHDNLKIYGRIWCYGNTSPKNFEIGENCTINSDYPRINPLGYNSPTTFRFGKEGTIMIGKNVGISNATIVSYFTPVIIHDNVLIGGGSRF